MDSLLGLIFAELLTLSMIDWSRFGQDPLQRFILLFMSLFTARIIKNSHVLAGIYFIFLKKVPEQTWKAFNTKLGPPGKDRKRSYEVTQILAHFYKLGALILNQNCVKSLRFTKIFKQIKFEEAWDESEAKNSLQRQSWTKDLRQTLVFMWNSALRETLNFYFSGVFC